MDAAAVMRAQLLALLLLITPATAREPYGNLDPCMIVDGQRICLESATAQEIDAWIEYHERGVIDEQEARSLTWWKWGSSADIGTTIVGLAICTAAKEANPIWAVLGPVAGPLANIGLSVWLHSKQKRMAAATSRYEGSAINAFGGKVRAGIAVSNTVVIARCL